MITPSYWTWFKRNCMNVSGYCYVGELSVFPATSGLSLPKWAVVMFCWWDRVLYLHSKINVTAAKWTKLTLMFKGMREKAYSQRSFFSRCQKFKSHYTVFVRVPSFVRNALWLLHNWFTTELVCSWYYKHLSFLIIVL